MTAFRKTVITAVMSTDMVHHFEMVATLTKREAPAPFDVNEAADRRQLVNMLVHAADISNPLIPDFS